MSETDTPERQPNLPDSSRTDLTGKSVNPQTPTGQNPQPGELMSEIDLEAIAQQVEDLSQTTAPSQTSSTELATLVTQIAQLRQHNTDLLEQVANLEAALEESQQQLQRRQERSTATEELLSQRFEELELVQGQNQQLLRELELAQQTAQRQQILIETLTEQLETNQEQVAQLERDCALAQQRYNEQTTQLSKAQKNCRDLRIRLYRQQRYTLQFKNALEKCLELNESGDRPATEKPDPVAALEIQGFVPKAPAIQPWSATSQVESQRWELDPDVDLESTELSMETENEEDQSLQSPRSIGLKEKTVVDDRAIASSEPAEDLPQLEEPPEQLLETMTGESMGFSEPERQETSSTSPTQDVQEPDEQAAFLAPSNSPSPLVYPLRPHKKIKSLAAIDLPSFPRAPREHEY